MLSPEDNALLTRTGPGTPAGELMRRYWQPIALGSEVTPGSPPLSVRILGEDLVLFRDDRGRLGLLSRYCAHRRADLSYGRLEDGGLRCLYHGWLFDVEGRCLEQPGEPAGSTFCQRVRQRAYPCQEAGGLVFAYFGPGEPPLLPAYEFLRVPAEQRFVTKLYLNCNYLQALEGGIDPIHGSFLHRIFPATERQLSDDRITSEYLAETLLGRDGTPQLVVERTDYGLQVFALRQEPSERWFLRVSAAMLPNLKAFAGHTAGPEYGHGHGVHWHVPIDDTHFIKFTLEYSPTRAIDLATFRREYDGEVTTDHRLVRNRANRYLQDREQMRTETYAGVGWAFQIGDAMMVETMEPIVDRSQEHLGYGDRPIAMFRRVLLLAIREVQAGGEPPDVVRDPAANRFPCLAGGMIVPKDQDWRAAWSAHALAPIADGGASSI